MLNKEQRVILLDRVKQFFCKKLFCNPNTKLKLTLFSKRINTNIHMFESFESVYRNFFIFTFQPSVRKISKNSGIIRLGQIFNLGPIKRNLKYLPGNKQDPIKK